MDKQPSSSFNPTLVSRSSSQIPSSALGPTIIFKMKLQLLQAALLAALPLVSAQVCDEGNKLACYGKPSGQSQNINLEDLEYAAWEFRRLSEDGPAFWTMPANITKRGCDEWMMFEVGTALALAKHTNNRITSSVSFDDIADTIDGGPEATPEQREKAIMGCGEMGSAFGSAEGGQSGLSDGEIQGNRWHSKGYSDQDCESAGISLVRRRMYGVS